MSDKYLTPLTDFEWRAWYEQPLSTIDEVHQLLSDSEGKNYYYRGLSKAQYYCISSFFRFYCKTHALKLVNVYLDRSQTRTIELPEINKDQYVKMSFSILDFFANELKRQSSSEIQLSYTSLMYLAQHYDLPTNLIDFTIDPKVGLYFACKESPDCDAVLYESDITEIVNVITHQVRQGAFGIVEEEQVQELIRKMTSVSEGDRSLAIPMIQESDVVYNQRIKNQKGCFVYLPDPEPYDLLMYNINHSSHHPGRKVYRIKAALKRTVLEYLEQEGINEHTMFPDETIDLNKSIIENAVNQTKQYIEELIAP